MGTMGLAATDKLCLIELRECGNQHLEHVGIIRSDDCWDGGCGGSELQGDYEPKIDAHMSG